MRRAKGRRGGFTLIELLVVIAIVSVLAAIAIPQYTRQQSKALESRIRQDIRNTALAQEAYWDVAGAYLNGGCDGLPGLRLSSGTVCVIERADVNAFAVRTSHPGTPKQCTWTSDSTPSLHCS